MGVCLQILKVESDLESHQTRLIVDNLDNMYYYKDENAVEVRIFKQSKTKNPIFFNSKRKQQISKLYRRGRGHHQHK